MKKKLKKNYGNLCIEPLKGCYILKLLGLRPRSLRVSVVELAIYIYLYICKPRTFRTDRQTNKLYTARGQEHQLPRLKLIGRAGLDPSHALPDGERLRTKGQIDRLIIGLVIGKQTDELSALPSIVIGELYS